MDAPERIWVDIREETLRNFGVPFVARGFLAAPPRTEYVRADALAAKDAEIERLRARIAEKDEALRECVYWMQFREKQVPGVDNISDRARKALEG